MTTYTVSQLKSVAAAVIKVRSIRSRYERLMVETDEAEKLGALEEEGSAEMFQAINDEGLTPRSYNEIVRASRVDNTLNRRLHQLIAALE